MKNQVVTGIRGYLLLVREEKGWTGGAVGGAKLNGRR